MEKPASLGKVWDNFCNGSLEMDNRQFAKLARDTGILDKKLTAADVDLIFNKVKANPSIRKIQFYQFEEAISHFAKKKGCKDEDIVEALLKKGVPTSSGTKAGFVKFHDDKSTYTGVHTKGGPTTVDNVITLSNLADRTKADVRGVKLSK